MTKRDLALRLDLAMSSRVEQAKRLAAEQNGDILALSALDRVRQAAFAHGEVRTRRPSAAAAVREELGASDPIGDEVFSPGPGWGDVGSGSKPSRRDPQPIAALLKRTVREKGWGQRLEVAAVAARWDEIVGPNVARHCIVEDFGEDGVLTLRASSTSWETQIKALLATLDQRIAAEVGEGVVKEIKILGPYRPSWKHGKFSVPGRGPRDTYG